MKSNIEFEYIRESEGRVRITPKMGKLPTLEQYIEIARRLLDNGLRIKEEENLKDPGSQDILDCIQLSQEFQEDFKNKTHTVVFSYKSGDICVNANNINKIKEQVNIGSPERSNMNAIREAVSEMLEK